MSLKRIRIGLSGHRELPNSERIKGYLEAALDRIGKLAPTAQLSGISSGAIGADLLFAEILLNRQLPWTLLLPFAANKFYTARDFPGTSLSRARALARKADRVIQVTSDALPDDHRRESFAECSFCTVDECDVFLAIWDGQPGRPGGTASAVQHARAMDRPLIWIDPASGQMKEERLEKLSAAALTTSRLEVPSEITAEFRSHTDRAKPLRFLSINLNILLVCLHQLATIVAIMALIWGWFAGPEDLDYAAITKVSLLIVAFFLPLWLHRRNHAWTEHRMQAEILRSVIKLWHLPDPVRVFTAVRPPAFDALQARLLEQRLAQPPTPPASVPEFKQGYLQTRVGTQLDYYRLHSCRAKLEHSWLHRAATACTGLAIISGLLIIFHVVAKTDEGHHWVKFFSIGLPLVAAAFLAAINARDLKRRTARYADMAIFLQSARRQVELAPDWETLTRAVIDLERRLLFENWEWYTVTRFSASH